MEKSSWPWGLEQDLLRVRMGLEWVVELVVSLLNRNVANFSTAQARWQGHPVWMREPPPGVGRGQIHLGQRAASESADHRAPRMLLNPPTS